MCTNCVPTGSLTVRSPRNRWRSSSRTCSRIPVLTTSPIRPDPRAGSRSLRRLRNARAWLCVLILVSRRTLQEDPRMAVKVSVPTILRTHTGGEKSVEASGSTVAEVIEDLESRHSGIKGRLVKDGSLHRFINVYVNDEDVRFSGGLAAAVRDGDNVTILPAV